jgi:hypothetical protein
VTRSKRTALALLCVALPAALPFGAKADPRVLTGPELGAVTAGLIVLPPIQINVNAVGQVAVATSVAVPVCALCTNPRVEAAAPATAFNINVAEFRNIAF